jgi:hypothetical protein
LFNDLFSSSGLGLNDNLWNTMFSSGFYMPGNFLGTMSDFIGLQGAGADAAKAGEAAEGAVGAAAADGVGGALASPAASVGGLGGGLGGAVSTTLERGTAIGLSVPPNWDAVAPATNPLVGAALGGTPSAGSPAVAAGVPGMPFANATGSHGNADVPRYGFRPTVVVRPLAAG